jgi:hypothetical protein
VNVVANKMPAEAGKHFSLENMTRRLRVTKRGRKPGRRRSRCFLPEEGDGKEKETHQEGEVNGEVDC